MAAITNTTLPNRFPIAGCNRLPVPAAAFSTVFRSITSVNPEFATLTRTGSETAILHKKADSFIHPNYLDRFLSALRTARPCCGTELVFLHSTGATRPFPTAIARFKDAYLMRVLANKADLVLVAEIAGHSKLETTRRYSLPTKEDKEKALSDLL